MSKMNVEMSKVMNVPLEKLQRNPWNCNIMSEAQMKSLQESMTKNGKENLQPLVVRALPTGKFQIVDGEHRYLSAKNLKWENISAMIVDLDEQEAKVMCIALNYIRGKIDPTRLFETFYADWEGGNGTLTTRQLEERYGHLFDQSWIVRILQLRNIAPEVREEVREIFNRDPDTNISVKHLIIISQLKEADEQMRFLKALLATNVSVGTLERMVREYQLSQERKASSGPGKDATERKLEDLGLREGKSKHGTTESMLKCSSCGSAYMVNWRRKSVLRLIEEGSITKAMHVQLT